MAKRRAATAKQSNSGVGCLALIVIAILIGLVIQNAGKERGATATAQATRTARPAATVRITQTVARTATVRPVQAQQLQSTQPPAAAGGGSGSGARPGNCSTAVAMGLSAEQAAEWPHLDRDGDHVACYGD